MVNFIEYEQDGRTHAFHLEEYRLGWVVCSGKSYGPAVSRSYLLRADAWDYMERLVEAEKNG